MKSYLLMGTLLVVSYVLRFNDHAFGGFVWYDKIAHMVVGMFFMYNYRNFNTKDNLIIVAMIFTFLYEIFVELLYPIPLATATDNQSLIEAARSVVGDFFPKYTKVDEWLDVISNLLGCIIGGILGSNIHEPSPEKLNSNS